MRDIDALLNSLVNIDRNSLIAILVAEVEAARQLVRTARQRAASQCAIRRDAEQRATRLDRMLSFFSERRNRIRDVTARPQALQVY